MLEENRKDKKMKMPNRIKQIYVNALVIRKLAIHICLLKKKMPQLQIYTYKGLIKNIKKRGDICHIIATGYSAISSYKNNVIKDGDFIIGMNDAAFLPYKFDFYFCEDSSHIDDMYKKITEKRMLLLEKSKNRIVKLVYKNIYSSDPIFFSEISTNIKYSIVLDTQLIYSIDIVKKLFRKPAMFVPQFSSTVITAVMLAYHLGFKKIVIHGLDFSGPHIYHDEILQEQLGIEAITPYVPKTAVHETASMQKLIWPDLVKYFLERGIGIYCASNESIFKKFASIWNENHRSEGDIIMKPDTPPPPPPDYNILLSKERCGVYKYRIAA